MVATVTELRSTSAAVDYYEKDGYYAKNDLRAPARELLARRSGISGRPARPCSSEEI